MNRFVKSVALSVAMTAGAASVAFAGGYTAPVVTPAPVIPAEVVAAPLTWAGTYGGATLGYAFGGDDVVGVHLNDRFIEDAGDFELSGVNAGLRVGHRFLFPQASGRTWFVAPELAIEGGNITDDFDKDGYEGKVDTNYVLGLRLKSGLVSPDQQWLFYGIAGAVHGDFDYSVKGNGVNIDESFSKTGYVVGLGVEKRMTERMSLTGEWEYANFGKETLRTGGYSTEATADYHNIKVGVNFQF